MLLSLQTEWIMVIRGPNGRAALGGKCAITAQLMAIYKKGVCTCDGDLENKLCVCQSFCNCQCVGVFMWVCSGPFVPETCVSVCADADAHDAVMSQHQCHWEKFLCISWFGELIIYDTDMCQSGQSLQLQSVVELKSVFIRIMGSIRKNYAK